MHAILLLWLKGLVRSATYIMRIKSLQLFLSNTENSIENAIHVAVQQHAKLVALLDRYSQEGIKSLIQ